MKKLVLVCACLCFSTCLFAQQKAQYTEKDYAKTPVWISMMNDPNVNFFEIEKAYDIYWQHHEKPESEEDIMGEKKEREKPVSKREQKKIDAENDMRFAVKRYEAWHYKMKPYVQQDGRILTADERLKLHAEEQKLKEQAKQ